MSLFLTRLAHSPLAVAVHSRTALDQCADRLTDALTHHALTHDALLAEDGQATTEYALVLLGAALVALLVIGWATAGGGAGKIGRLFDRVIDSVIDRL